LVISEAIQCLAAGPASYRGMWVYVCLATVTAPFEAAWHSGAANFAVATRVVQHCMGYCECARLE